MPSKRTPNYEYAEGIGHGKLYSPAFAIKVDNNAQNQGKGDNSLSSSSGSSWRSSSSFLTKLKERLLEKLMAASVPPAALNKAGDLLDATFAGANGDKLVNDIATLSRIVRERLVDAALNLSPDDLKKLVNDAAKELQLDSSKAGEDSQQHKKDRIDKEPISKVKTRL